MITNFSEFRKILESMSESTVGNHPYNKSFVDRNGNTVNYHLSRDVFTQNYCATLLGGEIANCHGEGKTEEQAIMALKLQMNAMRRAKQRARNEQVSESDEQILDRTVEQLHQLGFKPEHVFVYQDGEQILMRPMEYCLPFIDEAIAILKANGFHLISCGSDFVSDLTYENDPDEIQDTYDNFKENLELSVEANKEQGNEGDEEYHGNYFFSLHLPEKEVEDDF